MAKMQTRMHRMAEKLLRQESQGKGLISAALMVTLCGTTVSLTLAMSLVRYRTRALYDCLTFARKEMNGKRSGVRPKKVGRNGLSYRGNLGPEGRCM